MEQAGMAFHRRVYEGYKKIEREEPERFIAVDASGSKEETFASVLNVLRTRGIL